MKTHTYTHRHRHTDTQTHRHTQTQTQTQTQTDRQTPPDLLEPIGLNLPHVQFWAPLSEAQVVRVCLHVVSQGRFALCCLLVTTTITITTAARSLALRLWSAFSLLLCTAAACR